jgi:hypothetical protein
MPYAFIYDTPATEEMYRKIRALLPDEMPGLLAQVVTPCDLGVRHIGVWESKAAFDAFHAEQVDPAVEKVLAGYGLEPNDDLTRFEELPVLDFWS